MSIYQIETKHTDAECLRNMDELVAKDNLGKFYLGCESGIHAGWATIEAASESEALKIVPEFNRSRASIAKVSKMTPERVKQIHSMH
jgi:hypothetical protein